MIDRADLEEFPIDRLHEQAIGFAKADRDLDWLWRVLQAIPAAEGQLGDLDDSGMDIPTAVSAINGFIRADPELPELLRERYIDYILEHQ